MIRSALFSVNLSLLLLVFLAAPGPATADERLSAETFTEYATGYTLYYETEDGERFGSESFDEDGFVTWRHNNGICMSGGWRAYDDDLCFLFDGEVQCWGFYEDRDGAYVRPIDSDEPKLRITRRDRTPLSCTGSDLEL